MTYSEVMQADSTGRVVIGGASGFMGQALTEHYREQGREVVTIGRSGADVSWDDPAAIARAVDGASLVIGLSGKSVNCRYTRANRAEIFRSREETTGALSRAIRDAENPPPLWVNASSATIYRHAEDRPMTESTGDIGNGFSVDVVRAWERAIFADELPETRRVALRATIVLGEGSVLTLLTRLARLGLGGTQLDGRWPVTYARRRAGTAHWPGARGGKQRFSWVHLDEIARVIDFVETHEELSGPINVASPYPVDNRSFMRVIRDAVGAKVHFPMPRWMQEIGAIAIRTETELTLKSRWVLPETLLEAGYEFRYPHLEDAVAATLGAKTHKR